jgi:hypothetical protein
MGRPRKTEERASVGTIPSRFKDSAKKDCAEFRKHMDSLTEAAFAFFLAQPKAEREKLLKRFPNKVFGRPL